jgi:hypothetical protein
LPTENRDDCLTCSLGRPAAPPAASFARQVVAAAGPHGRDRAKNLLWAAGKLADWAIGLGLEPAPQVLLHPSVTERFATCAPGLSGPARSPEPIKLPASALRSRPPPSTC